MTNWTTNNLHLKYKLNWIQNISASQPILLLIGMYIISFEQNLFFFCSLGNWAKPNLDEQNRTERTNTGVADMTFLSNCNAKRVLALGQLDMITHIEKRFTFVFNLEISSSHYNIILSATVTFLILISLYIRFKDHIININHGYLN